MAIKTLAEKIDDRRLIIGRATERTDAKGLRDLAIFRLSFDMELKRGMVCRLDLECIDLENKSIDVIEKGSMGEKKTRSLPEPTIQALRNWIKIRGDEPGPLFNSIGRGRPGSGRLTGGTINEIINRASEAVGILNKQRQVYSKQRSLGACKKSPDKAATEQLYRLYKLQAERRNLAFDLDELYFAKFTKLNCYYCDTQPTNTLSGAYYGAYKYNGIDRVDNSKGYTIENCVPCCGVCNRMKRAASKEEFLAHIERIHQHQRVVEKKAPE